MTDEEIERMVNDAKAFEEEDKKRLEEIEIRNEADSLVYQTEKTLKDAGDKVDNTVKEKVEKAKDELKKALEGDNIEEIKTKKEALTDALTELSTQLYQQAQAEQQNQGEAGSARNDDKTVDVEYEEVNEDEDKEKDN